ncbi:hypothetical protein [Vibrio furnissii]|uniref:hypothetical protein n=1 Tax=Vibrio furnissii TaxID=29494 RepID=UPI001302C1B1|nr:hypothetical protein [Vibrio furnissii]
MDEGQDAVFTVTLSNASSSATTYEFDLGGATDTAGSDDYSSSVTFSNGVTYDSETGLITVPAGVTSFTATVQTTQDTIDEANETFTLTVAMALMLRQAQRPSSTTMRHRRSRA